ncbi:hypothetical protein GCM10022631_39380 [Deinococcus rubellus]|uniref:Type I restriction enzyme HsdR N-terminal domain-containing protein n=1 Tax=Deinococcus rubellus TaxID=1889240 RepID=A0ABY5YE26_9DEIO|nr:type I restriction enzyme HsdR N-terminal domain-containing protein [Deinococcus rubellus]UWX63073.1 type I restriction enzyme HsdR N-terminal domain-containing protein [Deinococcus rubellus]
MKTDFSACDFPLERDVEQKFILPLLTFLGYQTEQLHWGYAVQVGRSRGRYPEADVVVEEHNCHKLVIEAKKPGESLAKAALQGLTYAQALQIPAVLVTDGLELALWSNSPDRRTQCIWQVSVQDLPQHWPRLTSFIGAGNNTQWLPLLPPVGEFSPSVSQKFALAAYTQDTAALTELLHTCLRLKSSKGGRISDLTLSHYAESLRKFLAFTGPPESPRHALNQLEPEVFEVWKFLRSGCWNCKPRGCRPPASSAISTESGI